MDEPAPSLAHEVDIAHLRRWQGRTEEAGDTISPWLVAAFRATLDLAPTAVEPGDPVPQGLHWCLALPTVPMALIGPDGHPARGGFLPPVPLPRRMWAGGRVAFYDPLRIGDRVRRVSQVKSVDTKRGRTGDLVFVLVEHRISTPRGLAIVEEHDIVYRGIEPPASGAGTARPPEPEATLRRRIEPSPVLLFRYSALTFNGHRIHYDRPYVTEVEGYPGLIVHGPLQATLLMHLASEMLGDSLDTFAFRAVKPLFDLEAFTLTARQDDRQGVLAVVNGAGETTMTAVAGRAGTPSDGPVLDKDGAGR